MNILKGAREHDFGGGSGAQVRWVSSIPFLGWHFARTHGGDSGSGVQVQ
jgi:hypothetical protein